MVASSTASRLTRAGVEQSGENLFNLFTYLRHLPKPTTVLISGILNPLHSEQRNRINAAKELELKLAIAINSGEQPYIKKTINNQSKRSR